MNIGFRVVDLTAPIYPSQEIRKFTAKRVKAVVDDTFMHEMSLLSHIGTHIEVPSHLFPEAMDLAQTPIETLIGEAVLISLSNGRPGEPLGVSDIEKTGVHIRKGDALILRCINVEPRIEIRVPHFESGQGVYERGVLKPYISSELAKWFLEKGVRLIGMENLSPDKPIYDKDTGICRYENTNHAIFYEKNVHLLEKMANLDALKRTRFLLFVLPYPIGEGVDAFPTRVIALEPYVTI